MAAESSTLIPKKSHEVSNTCDQFDTVYSIIVRIFEFIVFFFRWVFARYTTTSITDSVTCLVGKTAIVTGGNSGIGYATATLLASRGCRIIIADKADSTASKEDIIRNTENPNISVKYLDLSSLQSIRDFAADIREEEEKIDILINNAGVVVSNEKSTKDGLNSVLQINFFSSFLLTHLLLEQLKSSGSGRVVFASSVSSIFHQLNQDTLNVVDYEGNMLNTTVMYSNSKLCNILGAQGFAERLQKYDITCCSVDPGTSNTPILNLKGNGVFGMSLTELLYRAWLVFGTDSYTAAQSAVHVASSVQSKLETGSHYFRCIPFMKPRICHNEDFCSEIWKKTELLVQLKPEEKLSCLL